MPTADAFGDNEATGHVRKDDGRSRTSNVVRGRRMRDSCFLDGQQDKIQIHEQHMARRTL